MLSYQHGYHAGSFADVVKHLLLTRLLNYLCLKEKPLFYLETHAGRGLYDLKSKEARKTEEYKGGIERLWQDRQTLPAIFDQYIQIIQNLNQEGALRYYPGSPFIAMKSLRTQDRLHVCERHPKEFEALEAMTRAHRRFYISQCDGIAAMRALLPPKEKRGLIFIDPAYELKEEYKQIPEAIAEAFQHFSNGIFCLWYPLIKQRFTEQLLRKMALIGAKNTLRLEFYLNEPLKEGMNGCGLCLINPTYPLAEEMRLIFEVLKNYFNPGRSSYLISSLV